MKITETTRRRLMKLRKTKIYINSVTNQLVTTALDCSYKFWDSSYKMPLSTYYDTEDKIISGDILTNSNYSNNGLFTCLDASGNIVFRPVNHPNEYKIIKLKDLNKSSNKKNRYEEYYFIKYSSTNEYHYYVSTSTALKVFDIRNFKELDSNENNYGFTNIIDTSKYLLTNNGSSIRCYSYENNMISTMELVKDYSINNASCMEISDDKDIFIGCENGDMYYSMYRNYDLNKVEKSEEFEK